MGFLLYTPICNALVLLFNPLVEIVIHDLSSETICFVSGHLSKRKVGDHSLLNKNDIEKNLSQITYPKLNFDGRLIKSISVPLDNQWLMCINCDVSVFTQLQQLSETFLQPNQTVMPDSLFKNDWQEKLHQGIHHFINEHDWHFNQLNHRQKKEIVYYLFQQGAFSEKNAADYIANALDLGRATIFNYLKNWRQHAED